MHAITSCLAPTCRHTFERTHAVSDARPWREVFFEKEGLAFSFSWGKRRARIAARSSCGQGLHERAKLIAAIGIAFEHVEGRCAGRKENDLAGFGDGVRSLDCTGERIND